MTGLASIGIPVSCLKSNLPIVKNHLLMREYIALMQVCLVCLSSSNFLLRPINRCIGNANKLSDCRWEDQIYYFRKHILRTFYRVYIPFSRSHYMVQDMAPIEIVQKIF